jgi:hypothetical protein
MWMAHKTLAVLLMYKRLVVPQMLKNLPNILAE